MPTVTLIKNPSTTKNPRRHRRGTRRNPGALAAATKSLPELGDAIAGLLGAGVVLTVPSMVMKTSTGWTRVIVAGIVGLGGAWAVRQFVNPKAGNAFGLGAAIIVLGQAAGVATQGRWGIPTNLRVMPEATPAATSALPVANTAPAATMSGADRAGVGAFLDTTYGGENAALNPPLA